MPYDCVHCSKRCRVAQALERHYRDHPKCSAEVRDSQRRKRQQRLDRANSNHEPTSVLPPRKPMPSSVEQPEHPAFPQDPGPSTYDSPGAGQAFGHTYTPFERRRMSERQRGKQPLYPFLDLEEAGLAAWYIENNLAHKVIGLNLKLPIVSPPLITKQPTQ